MLGSSHDGERAAAAFKATEWLKARNMTWEEFLLRAAAAGQAAQAAQPAREPHWSEVPKTEPEWRRALHDECQHYLSEWEKEFLNSVLRRNCWPLTAKQREVLRRMRDKFARTCQ